MSKYTGVYILRIDHSWLIFVLTVKESSKFTFCGKYYRSSTIYKRLSTIRLMNAVSWRNTPLHWGPSHFLFYIPIKRPKAHRSHFKHNQPFHPIPGHQFWTCLLFCISSSYHFKLSQALLRNVRESNGKDLHRRHTYGTAHEYYSHGMVY